LAAGLKLFSKLVTEISENPYGYRFCNYMGGYE
jgi:hypothetical protein